jgi:hypothetical protein
MQEMVLHLLGIQVEVVLKQVQELVLLLIQDVKLDILDMEEIIQ